MSLQMPMLKLLPPVPQKVTVFGEVIKSPQGCIGEPYFNMIGVLIRRENLDTGRDTRVCMSRERACEEAA